MVISPCGCLRYLLSNLGPLRDQARLREFTIHERPLDIAEAILAERPRIVGLGVYIWNVEPTRALVELLRALHTDASDEDPHRGRESRRPTRYAVKHPRVLHVARARRHSRNL